MSSVVDTYCSTTALFDDQSCVEDSCTEEERRHDVAVLTAHDALTGSQVDDELTCEAKSVLYVSTARLPRIKWMGCGQCRWRQAGVLLLGIFLTLSALTLVMVGAIRSRDHSALKVVHVKQPVDVSNLGEANFTIAQLLKLTSIAPREASGAVVNLWASSYRLASSQPPQLQHSKIENNLWRRVDLQYDVSIASVRITKEAQVLVSYKRILAF
ncbi:hypothetical protein RRG08_029484 [Elysia crispata]|uniref:Uncharacterized protein n=1 Tax=Elysia crispata TaxID=231223 RepID=A0AAE1E8X2_9GAST|nr:hypothetical protein RRG08_029484 [Elysia crispata]